MTDQNAAGTPGSTADVSVNDNNKSHAIKDKACPFCHQQFTSSSLGRHLDLYIKEKNPKPADGLHDIDEIRKLRGGITRRQPRNSASKREHSIMSMGTPSTAEKRSPRLDSEREKNRSPSMRRFEGFNGQTPVDHHRNSAKLNTFTNRGTWENTGVANNTTAQWGSDARSWDGEERDSGRRLDNRSRSVSRKILVKTSFEQKQKMIDALDNAKAAELALRELVGSLRAAKQQVQSSSILDFDPLTMDFPALCLHCLPPPPTLHTNTPIPSSFSWSLLPPDDSQYQALRNHFTSVFHNYRISLSFATAKSKQETSFPHQAQYSVSSDAQFTAATAGSAGSQLEAKINAHLQAIFRAWQALPPGNQSEIWTVSLARSVALKNNQIDGLKREVDRALQDAAHLRQQLDELSRMQLPKEFKIVPPRTTRIESEIMTGLGEQMLGIGVDGRGQGGKADTKNRPSDQSIDFNILDENLNLGTAVEHAIARWKTVVKDVRVQVGVSSDGSNIEKGMIAQQILNRDSVSGRERIQALNINMANDWERPGQAVKNESGVIGVGSDADADADMEEEDTNSFVEMVDAPPVVRAPPAHNQQLHHQNEHQLPSRDLGFRVSRENGNTAESVLNNNSCMNGDYFNQNSDSQQNTSNGSSNSNGKGTSNSERDVDVTENQVMGGYVRIGT